MLGWLTTCATAVVLLAAGVGAIDLDLSSSDSILTASQIIVHDILNIYNSNASGPAIPGLLPQPYYWWETGLMFDSLINYWSLSGDDSVVATVQEGLLFQVGPDNDFMQPNQTKSEGNDDQSSWALAAMTAAERGFPTQAGQNVSWLSLAQNVFDDQALRWDNQTCNGGLRWQIFSFNNGYDYKNSLSNGNFMQLAARLAHYTGNKTYTDWAQTVYGWSLSSGLVAVAANDSLSVYDGLDSTTDCATPAHILWTAAAGTYLSAVDYVANSSNPANLSTANGPSSNQLFAGSKIFLANETDVLTEVACAPNDNCNTDELSFKAILARALGNTKDMSTTVPQDEVSAILQASAKGAAAQCSGGTNGTTCGSDWSSNTWDGTHGLGQDLSALEIILANLPMRPLSTAVTGTNGTSSPPSSTTGSNGTTGGNATDGGSSSSPSGTHTNGALKSSLPVALIVLLVASSAVAVL